MPTSLVVADSLLAVDVGSVSTRAALFDVVDGSYRFLAQGIAPTTAGAPIHNVSEGIHTAIEQLQTITGRSFFGPDGELIMPAADNGSGVDTFAAAVSAGPPLKIVALGLLEDVSLESARRLAQTTYGKVMQVVSMNDRRKPETRIDTILRLRPNLVVAAGGTEEGASQSVLKLLESVGLACYMMSGEQRPHVLFAGNQALKDEIASTLGGVADLHFAPNIRPTLDVEQLEAAQAQLAHICSQIRIQQISGLHELNTWAGGGLVPSSTALGRIVSYLDKVVYKSKKGILGLDIGASATSVAASFTDNLILGVYPQFGLGQELAHLSEYIPLKDIMRWLTLEISEEAVQEYLLNKSTYPASLPATPEELQLEHAIARLAIQSALRQASASFPARANTIGEGLLPPFQTILATGSVLTRAPSLAYSALLLLDSVQPTGTALLILDQNQIMPALGAAAVINPILTVQVMDSSTLHLATVISPVGKARPGTPILRIKIAYENGQESNMEVKQGALEMLPLSYGQKARLHLYPLHRYDVGMGMPGRGGSLDVIGGVMGVIIDARGRPLALPEDRSKRQEIMQKWLWNLGGQ